jgi:uncharacterized protein (DUF1697 family)
MAELRDALSTAGFPDPRTYLQSGNVVLRTKAHPAKLEVRLEALIAERFGIEVPVIVRTADELRGVIERSPLAAVADDPKRYQVTFLEHELDEERLRRLEALAAPTEKLAASGREVYAWHPAGIARSRLWAALAAEGLGVKATARNWTTVTNLHTMTQTP